MCGAAPRQPHVHSVPRLGSARQYWRAQLTSGCRGMAGHGPGGLVWRAGSSASGSRRRRPPGRTGLGWRSGQDRSTGCCPTVLACPRRCAAALLGRGARKRQCRERGARRLVAGCIRCGAMEASCLTRGRRRKPLDPLRHPRSNSNRKLTGDVSGDRDGRMCAAIDLLRGNCPPPPDARLAAAPPPRCSRSSSSALRWRRPCIYCVKSSQL